MTLYPKSMRVELVPVAASGSGTAFYEAVWLKLNSYRLDITGSIACV